MNIAVAITRINYFIWFATFSSMLWYADFVGTSVSTISFVALAAISQSFVLTLPLVLFGVFIRRRIRLNANSAIVGYVAYLALCLVVLSLLAANYKLHEMYGFFIDGFVLNLLASPGGIEALGLTPSFFLSVAISIAALLVMLLFVARFLPFERSVFHIQRRRLIAAFMICFVCQGSTFAVSEFYGKREILLSADKIIWYFPFTAKKMLERFGLERPERTELASMPQLNSTLKYPVVDLNRYPLSNKYNVVWLVAESWRWDMLDPRIMPYTHGFAKDNLWFKSHYSGGNGTRMGVFSQFYGLYGSQWFAMLKNQRPPLLLEALRDMDYDLMAFTSAKFSYPEFDKTVFRNFSPSQLQSYDNGYGWQRDQKNVSDLIAGINSAEQPFFRFMFFESSHANYYFPDTSIVESEYLEDFDYLSVNIAENIVGIKNRYINACHHLDAQIERVVEDLKKKKLLENTILIITGDHGEEFMENGRWGHNSTFSQQQIRVPLVIHFPGVPSKEVSLMTSHLDLPATVLSYLGFDMESELYSHGFDMLSSGFKRDYTVVSDWHGDAIVSSRYKLNMSPKAALLGVSLTTLADEPVGAEAIDNQTKQALSTYLSDLLKFR